MSQEKELNQEGGSQAPYYCYLLSTGGTAGAPAMPQTSTRLQKMDKVPSNCPNRIVHPHQYYSADR